MKYGKFLLLIVLIGVLIGTAFFARQRISGNTETAQLKLMATAQANARQCQVTVTIDRPPNDVDLGVTITAKPGIRIVDPATNTGLNSVTREVGIVFPREERILTFNCFLEDGKTLHSGAYVVKAVANYRTPKAREGEKYATGKTLLYVELKPDTGTNVFLPGKDEFDALFSKPYEQGAYYQYKLDLAAEESKPAFGLLHIRINSKRDDFSPTLYVVVSGGVAFGRPNFSKFIESLEASLVNIRAYGIDSGGSRIITIPFSVIADAIPGSYGIKVLQAGQGETPGEMAPLYIRVTTSAESPGQLWLTPEKRTDAPLLTPAPTRDR
ncbi:MAG: hypothetical protein PVJ75_16050 [Chloroflexota bacterium]